MPTPASHLARFEIRRFRGPLPKIALAFVLLIPLLYGAIYLTANWDPYGRLDQLPVAVVNNDQPAEAQGKTINAGDDFVKNLVDGKTFDWHQVSGEEAAEGLREGDYYLTVTVPEDFSANLVSGQTKSPEQAKIMLRRNDANGFVIGSITNSAQDSITNAVDESAVAAYFEAVFTNLATIRDGMVEANDGAAQLEKGLTSAHQGSGTLETGIGDAADGSDDLATGASDLSSGLQTAKTGSSDLDSGLKKLKRGSSDLSNGADQVATGTQQLNDQVLPALNGVQKVLPRVQKDAKVASGSLTKISNSAAGRSKSISSDLDTASTNLDTLARKHPELKDDPAFGRVTKRVDAASGRASTIADHSQQASDQMTKINTRVQGAEDLTGKVKAAKKNLIKLNKGAHDVADGADTLHTGIATASSGASSLATGIDKASTGADKLSTGADDLSDGLGKLQTGAADLDSALGQLQDGATQLHQGLSDGVKKIPALTAGEQDKAVQVLSSPADVSMTVDNAATYYGRGLAPMFFSIALWVFGISVFLVVRPITGRALAGRASAFRLAITGWLPIGTIATLGGWLMLGSVWAFLGLNPTHPFLTIGLVTLGAICFSAIAHLLRTALGTPGSSLLLVWLILQLTASGGTYPTPVLPQFFQALSPLMPMTYLIDAFRVTISGGELSHLLIDVLVLAGFAVVALALCVLAVSRRKQFSMKDLHPPLVSP